MKSYVSLNQNKLSRFLFQNDTNLIQLPVIDHAYFDDLVQEIEDNPEDVVYVDDAVPFNGVYPSHVVDRTLQTPATTKNFQYDREVDMIDPEERLTLNAGEGLLPPPNTPLTRTGSHPGITEALHDDEFQQQQIENPEQPRQRRHHRSIFTCFKSKTDSP